MTTWHPEEGTLQTFLDGESDPAAARTLQDHLDRCAACRVRLIELEGLAVAVRRQLEASDPSVPPTGVVQRAVRRASLERRRRGRQRLAAVASVVLLFGAGAAAAMPGSPLRDWLESRVAGSAETVNAPPEVAAPFQDVQAAEASIGVGVSPVDDQIVIILSDVAPGSGVDIAVIEGDRAYATLPAEARLESGPGWMGARVGSTGGEIRIELPTGPHSRVQVDGELVFSVRAGRVVHPAPLAPAPIGSTFRLEISGADDGPGSNDAEGSTDAGVQPSRPTSVSGTPSGESG